MSTVSIIEQYYAAFNQRDWTLFFSLLADNVRHDINHGSHEIGKAAFHTFMNRMNQCYEETIENICIMTNTNYPDRAAVEYVVHGKYLRTDTGLPEAKGQIYQLPGGAFFEIKNGTITRITNYYNLADWLKQIGA